IKEESLELKNEPIDDYPDIKEAGSFETMNESDPLNIPSEAKEEPLDVKDEPTDDFSDINHDEPIADMYCPSTGTSRPFDQSSQKHSGELKSVDLPVYEAAPCNPVNHRSRHQTKDEQLAASYALPLSAVEIAELSQSVIKKILKKDSLTESQRQLIRKIRKRGKQHVTNR
ncbi:hypothetical protein PMAYCL1PPCAC_27886, partial [Pristionchus mayeri]